MVVIGRVGGEKIDKTPAHYRSNSGHIVKSFQRWSIGSRSLFSFEWWSRFHYRGCRWRENDKTPGDEHSNDEHVNNNAGMPKLQNQCNGTSSVSLLSALDV